MQSTRYPLRMIVDHFIEEDTIQAVDLWQVNDVNIPITGSRHRVFLIKNSQGMAVGYAVLDAIYNVTNRNIYVDQDPRPTPLVGNCSKMQIKHGDKAWTMGLKKIQPQIALIRSTMVDEIIGFHVLTVELSYPEYLDMIANNEAQFCEHFAGGLDNDPHFIYQA